MKWLILVLALLTSTHLFADYDSQLPANVLMAKLITKEKNEIHSYSGFRFDVDLVDYKPNISINFMSVINNNPSVVKIKALFLIRGGGPNTDEEVVLNKINAFNNLKSVSVTDSTKEFDDDEGEKINNAGGIIRFDFLDDSSKKRASEWRYLNTGFKFMTATFDTNGDLLGLTFYSHLLINETGNDIEGFDKVHTIRLDKTKSYKTLILHRIVDVKRFSNELLKRSFEIMGRNLNDEK